MTIPKQNFPQTNHKNNLRKFGKVINAHMELINSYVFQDVYAFLYYVLYESFRTKFFVLSAEQLTHKLESKHSLESTAWMSNIRKEFSVCFI